MLSRLTELYDVEILYKKVERKGNIHTEMIIDARLHIQEKDENVLNRYFIISTNTMRLLDNNRLIYYWVEQWRYDA